MYYETKDKEEWLGDWFSRPNRKADEVYKMLSKLPVLVLDAFNFLSTDLNHVPYFRAFFPNSFCEPRDTEEIWCSDILFLGYHIM